VSLGSLRQAQYKPLDPLLLIESAGVDRVERIERHYAAPLQGC
jgi:hypothetical protein